MTKDEAIERILHSLPKVYYFIRHQPRKYIAIKSIGRKKNAIKKDDPVHIDVFHFSTLWLIETLTEKEELCERKELEKMFLWKYPGRENTFAETVINKLDAVGLIEQEKHEEDRRKNKIKLTPLARQLLGELRENRRKNFDLILSLLGIELGELNVEIEENYENVVRIFVGLAENVWDCILSEASVKLDRSDLQ